MRRWRSMCRRASSSASTCCSRCVRWGSAPACSGSSSRWAPAAIWPKYGAPLMFAQQLLSDGFFMAHMILATSLRQKLLAENEIARANGLFQAIGGIGLTVTPLLAGFIAEVIGVGYAVMLGAVFALLAMFPLMSPALLSVKDEGDDPTAGEPAEVVLQDGETPTAIAPQSAS